MTTEKLHLPFCRSCLVLQCASAQTYCRSSHDLIVACLQSQESLLEVLWSLDRQAARYMPYNT